MEDRVPFQVVCIDAVNNEPIGSPRWGYLNLLKEGETYTVEIVNSFGGYKLAEVNYDPKIGGIAHLLPLSHVPAFEPTRFRRIESYSDITAELAQEAIKERVEVDGPIKILQNN